MDVDCFFWEQQGEWKGAIGDVHKKAAQEQSEVSRLKEQRR
jgi:hypothetical protein